jgi:hypothetical protein
MKKSSDKISLSRVVINPISFLIALNFVIFYKYWLGISTPPWDFLGGGMVEQYRFYKDGGFFTPPTWFPYAWFGIPEYQMLQDGGWFLPVALVAELIGWHPANAARVQAFMVLFGSIGTYFLSTRFITTKWINLLAGILYAFIPAFYSNAQHYGVVRSASLLPWILYFLHPKTIKNSRMSIFLGSIIIFQSIVGSYPGNLISSIYTAFLFIIFFGLFKNPWIKDYILKISIMGILGILMGLIRYLPTLRVQSSFPSEVGNQAGINFYNLNYLIFPYVGDTLPWQNLTLRSLYIGSVVLPVLFFYKRKINSALGWITLSAFSIIMMTYNSINSVLRDYLPLADISRFAITDWRNTFNLSIIMLSVLIISNLKNESTNLKFVRAILFSSFLTYIIFASYQIGHTYRSLTIYSLFAILIFLLILFRQYLLNTYKLILIPASCLFGIFFVFQNGFSWMTTVKEQNFNIYNNTFTNVFEYVDYPLKSRPERVSFLPTPLTEDNYRNDQRYNRFWLTGGFGAYGYHNIKDINAYSSLFPRLEKDSDPVVKFLLSKGKQVINVDDRNLETLIQECTESISCSNKFGVKIKQIVFDRDSEVFEIEAEQSFTMIQNEIFSPIWVGNFCIEGQCERVNPSATLDSLRTWQLPKGKYELVTTARTPLNTERWILFYSGALGALISLILNKTIATKRSHRQL